MEWFEIMNTNMDDLEAYEEWLAYEEDYRTNPWG